jgi:hypothetical protein
MLVISHATFSQVADSAALRIDSVEKARAAKKKLYSGPRKASIMSALVPGLGQVYNRKYWKVPIVYAGLGGFGYMFYYNNSQYNDFRKAVIAANDNNPNTTYDSLRYSPAQLKTLKDYYKKYRDFSIFGLGIIYLINIIDANVDAHLRTFDVSDNLSLRVEPWYMVNPARGLDCAVGLNFKFNLK